MSDYQRVEVGEGADVPTQPVEETTQPVEETPRMFAEKFESADDLEKAYLELQSKLGQQQEAPKEAQGVEDNVETPTDFFGVASQEFSQNGELTKETVEGLEKAGVPKEFIDSYVENMTAKAELTRLQIMDSVGGEKSFERLSGWAQQNLSSDELAGYNSIIDGGNVEQIKLVLGSLKDKMGSTNFVAGDTRSGGSEGFTTRAQMSAAVNDPRYSKDASYRADVERRMQNSNF